MNSEEFPQQYSGESPEEQLASQDNAEQEELIFEESAFHAEAQADSEEFPWRYHGQTTEELLALKDKIRHAELVMAFAQALWGRSAESQSQAELVITVVETLVGEVFNGGFSLFFTNSSVKYAPIAVQSLLAIGCFKTAAIVEKALAVLRLDQITTEAISDVMKIENKMRDRLLDECDREFYKYEENVPEMEFQFILTNRDSIRIP